MRTIMLVGLFALGIFWQAQFVSAQSATVSRGPDGRAAAEIAARADAMRYYWHNGDWWYYTAQGRWLRWNGSAWIAGGGPFVATPVLQFVPQYSGQAPSTYYDPYRYEINKRRAGL